jgi:hypothetical protein
MDQDAFRETYRDVNERACVFERAVLTNQCTCSRADRFCIAEREGVACNSAEGNRRCEQLVSLLREHARFALRAATEENRDPLPYGKAMRVQVGGLRGLRAIVDAADTEAADLPEVFSLVERAVATFGALDALPFSEIMPYIASYRGRSRSRRRRT